MDYNCPKCHCGCLFEDHGKLICMNCGAETNKAAASKTSHVHHYKTYTAPSSGSNREKPKIVRRSTATKSHTPRSQDDFKKKKQGPLPKIAAVITIFAMLSPLLELAEDAIDNIFISTVQPAPEYMSPDSTVSGLLYWEVLGEVPEEEMLYLDSLIQAYNEKNESPDVESVVAFLEEHYVREKAPFSTWTVVQDGSNVRITFEK